MWVVYQPAAWQPGVVIQGVKSRRSLAVYRETVVVSRVREPGVELGVLSFGRELGFMSRGL